MKFASQNLQPFQLEIVKITSTGQTVNANLGNAVTPFFIHREMVPVLIKTGDFATRHFRSTKYVEVVLTLTDVELETLYRMVAAVDLGYDLLLSLPMLNLTLVVSAEVLTAMLRVGESTYYAISFFDTPVHVGWWRRFLNRWSKKPKSNPMDAPISSPPGTSIAVIS